MAVQAIPTGRAIPRELARGGILIVAVMATAVLLGQGRVLPAPTGQGYQLDQKSMEMQRVQP